MNPPYQHHFCLPWWFVKDEMTIEETVVKVLFRETWVFCDHMKFFNVFSNPERDPRARIVSIGCYAIISNEAIITKAWLTQISAWFYPLKKVWHLWFDHNLIVDAAYTQLQQDVQSSDIVKYFLPKLFTIEQLKNYCEIIYNRTFEKRNFVKYIQSHFKIKKTNKKEFDVNHRPASFYKFINL